MARLNLTVPEEFQPFLWVGTSSWEYDSWQGLLYPSRFLPAASIHL